MSEHTKGRLVAMAICGSQVYSDLETEDGDQIAEDIKKADARRLAACWNSCEGLDTAQLEALPVPFAGLALGDLMAVRKELAAARALLREVITETGTISYIEKVARARDYLDACDTLGDGNG